MAALNPDVVVNQLHQINIEETQRLIKQKLKQENNSIIALQNIKKELINLKLNVEMTDKTNTRWSSLLGNDYTLSGLNRVRSAKRKQAIANKILQAYELTSKILQDLELITPIQNVVTFIDNDFNYVQLQDFHFTADMVYLNRNSTNKGKTYGVRLNQAAFKTKIEEAKIDNMYEEINNHFKGFSQPIIDYNNNNNIGWKINKGVLAEAFRRHWQAYHLEYQGDGGLPNDFGSVGQRWWLYRLSSGSDPYFTGPDTGLSQVKNINASIVSNVNTVINTMEGIFYLVKEVDNLQQKKDIIQKIFKQNAVKPTISNKIYEGVDEHVKAELDEIIKNFNMT